MENLVRGRARTAGANSRRGATKKGQDFTQLFFHKSTLLSTQFISMIALCFE